MKRRLDHMYTELHVKPYKLALKYYDIDALADVIEIRRYFSYGEYVCGVLEVLAANDPDFLAKVCAIDDAKFMASPHKTRRYIAERKDLLYINSPHLADQHSRKVGELWVVTNIGRIEALAVARAAAVAKGVKRSVWSQLKV